jgi:hypothetical protein
MSAPQKTGWAPDGEYLGPFTVVTTFPCPVPGSCPCAAPCQMMAKVCKMPPLLDPVRIQLNDYAEVPK